MYGQQSIHTRATRHAVAVPRALTEGRSIVPVPSLTADNLARAFAEPDLPVLVHCMASWAAPCRAQAEEVAALATASSWRFGFYALDVHREEEVAACFKVRALPTLLLFRGGRLIERMVGLQSAARLRSALIAAECFPVAQGQKVACLHA